jgi:hypothetical protein
MKRLFLLILLISTSYQYVNAQGCSDAGGCSVGGLQPQNRMDSSKSTPNVLKAGYTLGFAKRNTMIHQWYGEWQHTWKDKWTFQFKVPFQVASGELGNQWALSDVITSITHNAKINNVSSFKTTLGFRLPTGRASIASSEYDSLDLPMVYQGSLGTFDLILNATYRHKAWLVGVGYQQVLIHNNKNNYLPTDWMALSKGSAYDASNQLRRGNDLMFRLEYRPKLKSIQPFIGMLCLYRLKGDSYLNAPQERITPAGSKGTTLNGVFGLAWNISNQSIIELTYAQPFINRTVGADGLLRSKVVHLSYSYLF